MQLEGVGGVSVGGALVQVGGQVDDRHSLEGTFLDTDAATDAQTLRNGGNPGNMNLYKLWLKGEISDDI